jgi:PAS domain S-box-containing protein
VDCAFVTIDADGQILAWSADAEALLGWPQQDVMHRAVSEIVIAPVERAACERWIARLASPSAAAADQRLTITAARRSGGHFPAELVATPLRLNDAALIVVGLRDLSVHERMEQVRRRSAASFQMLFSANPLPMWVYDVETLAFLEVNEAALSHYGYSRAEFMGMRLSDITPDEDVPRLKDTVSRFAAMSEPVRRTAAWRHRLRNGRLRDVDAASHALDFDGRRASLVVLVDVTEVKEIQATLAKSRERLDILHRIDRALIAAEDPKAIAEAALRPLRDLLGVPRVIVNLFDLEAGEAEWLAAIGRRRSHVGPGVRFPLSLMGDVDGLCKGEIQVVDVDAFPRTAKAEAAVEALLASGVHLYMVVPMIADGELIGAVSFGGAPDQLSTEQISIAQEVATQMAIVITQARLHERVKRQAEELERRVTERTAELMDANHRLEREISDRRRAEEEADRANQAKSDFLSRMSHELRTPLNAIIGFGQLLEMRLDQGQDRESVEQILRGGRHLLSLINEILDISRIESGRLPLSPEPVQIGEAVKRAVDLARPLASGRRISLSTAGTDLYSQYVLADAQRLQQVLLNLISNGIKYNRADGRVTVACLRPAPGRLRLTVGDTGAGIPAELRARLFMPFDRLGAEGGGVEGTGLGLALSKRLVEAMGGMIGVESVDGEGSVFWVELAETDSPDACAGLTAGPAAAKATMPARGTLLYIEDNPSNLRLIERVLGERTGVRFIAAMQGRLGLALAREHRPDLILVDLHLPDMSGEDVLRELKSDPALQPIPAMILSADATPGQVKRLLAAGAHAYLTKPLDIQELLGQLDAVMPK